MAVYIFFLKIECICLAAFINKAHSTWVEWCSDASLSRANGICLCNWQGTSTLRNATVAALRQRLKPKLAGNNRFSGWVGWLPKACSLCATKWSIPRICIGVNGHVIYISYTSLQSQSFKQKIQILRVSLNLNQFVSSTPMPRYQDDDFHLSVFTHGRRVDLLGAQMIDCGIQMYPWFNTLSWNSC